MKSDLKIIIEKPLEFNTVYAILNPITKKVYVGETVDYNRRISEHILSICGESRNSNTNLMNDCCKTYEIFPVICSKYDKRAKNSDRVWTAHETIVMYIFRKNGFELYNSNKNKDDQGYERSFLFDTSNPLLGEKSLKDKTEEFLAKHFGNFYTEYGYKKLQELFDDVEREINNSINKRDFGKNLKDLKNNNIEKIFEKRIATNLDNSYYKIKTHNDICKICNQLLSAKLSTVDLKQCGIREMEKNELLDEIKHNKFERVVFSKFGHYIEQSPITILSTKMHDINNNSIEDFNFNELGFDLSDSHNHKPICLWALKRLTPENSREFLSYSESNKKTRYIIMPYTKSKKLYDKFKNSNLKVREILNPQVEESLEAFFERLKKIANSNDNSDKAIANENFAFGYYKDTKSKEKSLPIPKNMIPPIISKTEKTSALLISDLKYINAECDNIVDLYKFFNSKTNDSTNELTTTLSSSTSHVCAYLKNDDVYNQDSLCEFFEKSFEKSNTNNSATFLIGKLEYPYIIYINGEKCADS